MRQKQPGLHKRYKRREWRQRHQLRGYKRHDGKRHDLKSLKQQKQQTRHKRHSLLSDDTSETTPGSKLSARQGNTGAQDCGTVASDGDTVQQHNNILASQQHRTATEDVTQLEDGDSNTPR